MGIIGYIVWTIASLAGMGAFVWLCIFLNSWVPIIGIVLIISTFKWPPIEQNTIVYQVDEDNLMYDRDAENINNILQFIRGWKERNGKEVEELFTAGYCYWFARILQERFGGRIYYVFIDNHYLCKIKNRYWDITGEVRTEGLQMMPWDEVKIADPNEYQRLVRDCIKKNENAF